MATYEHLHAEDVLPVHSRVSWGAIWAGTMVALAIYFVLTVLGTAIGVSVAPSVESGRNLAVGASIYMTVTTLIALFCGGWVASQFAVGESKLEAACYGVILWSLMFAVFMGLVFMGAGWASNAAIGLSNTPAGQKMSQRLTEQDLRAAGITPTPEQIEQLRSAPRETQQNTEVQARQAAEQAKPAAWWAFVGVVLTMIASIAGAMVGAGHSLTLRAVEVRSTTVRPAGSNPPPPPLR